MSSDLLYGKDKTEKIVSICYKKGYIYKHMLDGTYSKEEFKPYIITDNKLGSGTIGSLIGNLRLNKFAKYDSPRELAEAKRKLTYGFYFSPRRFEEQYMIKEGVTNYMGMSAADLKILSFDIETTSLNPTAPEARVLLITNYFQGESTTFNVEDYPGEKEMIAAWCDWVCKMNPHALAGHNVMGFDLPYLKARGSKLTLGRQREDVDVDTYNRRFRKDGSQSYEFNNITIQGRQIIDTFFLSIKYDVGRKYPNYRLKGIIAAEGLEKKGRQHYDAANIKNDWKDLEKRAQIIQYAEEDAEDVQKLLDFMLPQYFEYCKIVPMNLQELILTNAGAQLNYIMTRAYLQEKHSLPVATARSDFEGGISFGNPGLYKHVNKVDVASLYPSIMLSYGIGLDDKDPKNYFGRILKTLTHERLENKRLAKETGERHYDDIQQAQKIIINSAYGFMGATGLAFNNPAGAAKVTKAGREILKEGISWAEKNNFAVVNADTDSFSYTTGKKLSEDEFEQHISEVNKLSKPGISWENDGTYKAFLVVKAKNYVLQPYKGERTTKGSALKATMKEPALRQFINDVIECIIKDQKDALIDIYDNYAIEAYNVKDISRWASKKTITEKVLRPERTNEQRVLDAVNGRPVSEGDKIFVFFEKSDKLAMVEDFSGTYCRETLFKKLYKTLEIFDSIIDVGMIPNYGLKRNFARITTKGEMYEAYNNSVDISDDTLNDSRHTSTDGSRDIKEAPKRVRNTSEQIELFSDGRSKSAQRRAGVAKKRK